MKRDTRIWAAGAGVAVVAIMAGGFLLGVQPALDRIEAAEKARLAADGQAQTMRIKLAALARTAAKSDELNAKQTVLSKAVPSALQSNTFIRRVNAVAALDAVTVQSITVGDGVAYSAPARQPDTSAKTSAVEPADVVVTDPAVTAQNFTVVPMSVTVTGDPGAGRQLAKDLQGDERLFLISGFSSSTDPDTGVATTTLNGSVYALTTAT